MEREKHWYDFIGALLAGFFIGIFKSFYYLGVFESRLNHWIKKFLDKDK